jgi:PAS domain S-box-containing protein
MPKARVELVRASKLEGLALRRDPQRLASLARYASVQFEATNYAGATLERVALVLNTPNLFLAWVAEHHLEVLASKNLNLEQHIPMSVALEILLSEHLHQLQESQTLTALCQALHLPGRFAGLIVVPLKRPNGALLGCIGVLTPLPIRLPASQQSLLEHLAADFLEKIELRLEAIQSRSQSAPVMDADLWGLLSSTSEAMLACDLDGKICFWNRAAEKIYGYSPQQTIGRELGFLLSPESHQIMQQLIAQVLLGEQLAPFLVEHRHSSGFRVNVRMALSCLQDRYGNTKGLVMVCGVPDNPQQTIQHLMLERLTQQIPMLALQLDSGGMVVAAQGKLLEPSLVMGRQASDVFADAPQMLLTIDKALGGQFLHTTLKWQQRHFECWFVPWKQGISLMALDVSQQMQTRLALETSEQQMRELIHALPIYFWRCDPFGTLTMLEASANNYVPQIVKVGLNLFELFSESSVIVTGLRNVLMGETIHTQVEWGGRCVEVWSSPLFEKDRIVGATGVALDVTSEAQQRQALEQTQTALRQEQERTHILANSISQGLSIVDNDGIFVYVNPARAKMQGYTPEEMIGQSATDFLEPSEQPRFWQMTEWARSGESIQATRRIKHRDGTWLEVQLFAKAWYKDGLVAGVVSILNDITEQQALKQHLALQQRILLEQRNSLMPVFEASSQGMALLGEDGVVEYINPALQKMLGLAEAPLYSHAFFAPQDLPRLEALWKSQQHHQSSCYQAKLVSGQLVQLEEVPDKPQGRFLGSVLVVTPTPQTTKGLLLLPNIATALQFLRGVGGISHFQASFEPNPTEPTQPRLVLRGRSMTVVVESGTLEQYQEAVT